MRGRNYCWILLFLIVSGLAQAADYAWYSPSRGWVESTPMALCIRMNSGNATGMTFSMGSSGIDGRCKYNGADFTNNYIQRTGNSCPTGTAYNSATGVCVSTSCEQNWSGGEKVFSASKGQCVPYPNLSAEEYCTYGAGSGAQSEATINSNSPNGPEQYVDTGNKCVTTTTSADCTSRVNADGDGAYHCKLTGVYTGDYNPNGTNNPDGYCPTGDCTEVPEVPEVPTPTPTEYNDQQPCNYASDGNGGLTCTSSSNNEKEGTSNCGTVNGVWQCINKAPSNNGIEIVSNVQTTSNPDGSTTTTKTDTANTTACKGIGQCTTSTTTTTTTTVKDSGGNTTSVSGSCTGPQCPDENTNPDGDGDGFGDCIGEECGEGGSGGPSDLELEDVPGFGESASTFYNRVLDSPIPTALQDIRAPAGGVCPTYSVETYYGEVDYSSHCELIEGKRSLIELIAKTLWALLAVYVFLG